jgi:hypothetical protein
MSRRFGHYAIKTLRVTSWPLLFLMLLYLVTGFAMSGRFGFGVLMNEKTALAFHKALHVPLLMLFPVHAVCAVYLAMRRWRWIK